MKKIQYKHLTEHDRIRIEVLLSEGRNQIDIAKIIGVDRSTISREIRNRGTPSKYFGKIAHINYKKKRQVCRPKRKIEETPIGTFIISRIRAGWSPETIAGRIALEIKLGIRPKGNHMVAETIYKFIYESEFGKQEKLYQYLRNGKKRRTRKFGRKSHKEIIPNRVFIDLRSNEANERREVGHWEGDTIHYAYKQGINSLVDRKTRYLELTKLDRRTARETEMAVINKLSGHIRKSLTVDNGTENYRHEAITARLRMPIYFCHAYHSWEKGTNENTNGIVRRYLPKRSSLVDVSQTDLDDIADEINGRPRKILGYYMPKEVLRFEYSKLINRCT